MEIRSWTGRDALLRDRALILGELVKMHVGRGRLATLWLWAAVAALGWSCVGSAIMMFEESYDGFGVLVGLVAVIIGACLLIPAVVFVVIGLARDRRVRGLLDEWGALDRDPEGTCRCGCRGPVRPGWRCRSCCARSACTHAWRSRRVPGRARRRTAWWCSSWAWASSPG
ncbi:hypothetical protein NKH18_31145 [Streptomyces sp. M10(2022)]